MCDDEAGFRAALDAAPGDQTIRSAFADWLRDRDDPRADGYAALAAVDFNPAYRNQDPSVWLQPIEGGLYWYVGTKTNSLYASHPDHARACLSAAWFRILPSRREPEDDW
jgi:uncharacterized protein (TIGR02996 family)